MSKFIDKDVAKKFYSMRLLPSEYGMEIFKTTFYAFHETPCFYFCAEEFNLNMMNCCRNFDKETQFQKAKRSRIEIKRVSKTGSRIAFDTEEKAFNHLIFMKEKQITYLKRDLEQLDLSLNLLSGKRFNDLPKDRYGSVIIDGTQEFVSENYRFD